MKQFFQTVVRFLLVLSLAIAPVSGAFAALDRLQAPDSVVTSQPGSMADMNIGHDDMQMTHDCCKKQPCKNCKGCQDAGSSCQSCVTGHSIALDAVLLSLDHFHDSVSPTSRQIWQVQFPDLLERPPLSLI